MAAVTWIRMFHSAIDPADVDGLRSLFAADVIPAFTARPGCLGIELLVSHDANAGGLVDGAAVSRWASLDAMESAIASREVAESLVRVMKLLRQEPVVRTYEVLA